MKEIAVSVEVEDLVENLSTKDSLLKLEALITEMPKAETELNHVFADGIYVRELIIPANSLCTTYIHKTNNIFFIYYGELLVWDDKSKWLHFSAPYKGLTKQGTKRVIYTIEPSLWVTVHPNPNNIKDIDILEDLLFKKVSNPYLSLHQLETIK